MTLSEPDPVANLPAPGGDTGPHASTPEQQVLFGVTTSWAAPYPPPEWMRQYQEVLPSAPERMLAMAERDLAARLRREDDALQASIEAAKTGQSIAAFIAVLCVTASIAFFAFGNAVAGGVFAGVPTVLLVRAFLIRK